MAELPDGRLLLSARDPFEEGLVMACLLADGTPDPAFGVNGVSREIGQGGNQGGAFVVLPDGGTLQFAKANLGIGGALRRDASGQVVTSFGNNGFLEIAGYAMQAGTLLPSERIVCYGFAFGSVEGYSIAGLTPDPVADGLPVIGMDGTDLIASGSGTFQWSLGGDAIPGATNNTYTPTQNGTYTVTLARSADCVFTSAPYELLTVGIDGVPASAVRLLQNPVEDVIVVANSGNRAPFTLRDIHGRAIAQGRLVPGMNILEASSLSAGIYLLDIGGPSTITRLRVVKH